VLRQYAGTYTERALKEIAEVDVLVGMLTSANANVTFELAVRHVLRDGLILLVDEAFGRLPIYLSEMVTIDYKCLRSPQVDKEIRHLAADDSRAVDYDPQRCDPDVLDKLAQKIDEHEGELTQALEHALRDTERGAFLRPPYFRDLARYMSPQALLESWRSDDPLCVIQVDWKRRSRPGYYCFESDFDDGPWVCAGNDGFRELFALQGIPDPNVSMHPLGGQNLMDRLTDLKLVEPADLDAFTKDQMVVGPKVFLEGRNVTAGVPLAINDQHEPRYRNRRFLPSVIARATVGPEHDSHRTYLVVAYVPVDAIRPSTAVAATAEHPTPSVRANGGTGPTIAPGGNGSTAPVAGASGTNGVNGTSLWRELHALQTTLCWSEELPFYYGSPTWLRAQSVLDVGAGHGDYLRALAERFPDKHYLGVDVAAAYVAEAAHETTAPNVRFTERDVFALDGRYDFVLARLLLQHLEDAPTAITKMLDVVAPGGSLLLIDALDEYRAFHPPLIEFPRFFERYACRERASGRDRNVLSRVPQLVAGIPGVSIGASRDLLVPSSMPGHIDVFRAVYSRVIDLLAPELESECDVGAVRREWTGWCTDDHAYAQVGLRLIRIDKT
jgi:SAM-dependent methyltransferase